MPVDIGNGVMAETVGEILGDTLPTPMGWSPFVPQVIEGYAVAFPAPGIYFDMPDEHYHAIPALSQSGIKKLAASPMLFWASCGWLNAAKKERVERAHFAIGKAYHCRLLEGVSEFALRFVTSPDRDEYEGLLESTAQIKDAITKVELFDVANNPIKIKPVSSVEEDDGKGGTLKRPAKKEDWIKQLLELDPEALIWEAIEARHKEANAGKAFIHADAMAEIEIAAMMIERDPGIAPWTRGGMAEVSLFWYCPKTGVPMKARVDKLKVRGMLDLKSIANQRERSIENAIRFDIATYKYNLQPSVYFEGAGEVRKIVRKHGDAAVHVWDSGDESTSSFVDRVEECRTFAKKWASHVEPDFWRWIFQQKGEAPITRGVEYLRGGTVNMVTDDIVSMAKKRFMDYSTACGTTPWLDIAPPYVLADEDVPQSATEI